MPYKYTFVLCILFHLNVGDATQACNLHLHQMINNGHPSNVSNQATLTIVHNMKLLHHHSIKPLDHQHKSTLGLIPWMI
jgi:hypothetical protein